MFLYHIQINCIRFRIQKKLVGDEPTNLRNMLLLVCNLNCGHYSMLHVFCHVLMYLKVLKNFTDPPSACEKGCFRAVCAVQRPCCRQLMVVVTQQAEKHEVVVFWVTVHVVGSLQEHTGTISVRSVYINQSVVAQGVSTAYFVQSRFQGMFRPAVNTVVYIQELPNMGPYQLVSTRV
jgi:hypothetical protein